ncbi:hypothetical protein TanjilG_02563 [Lupinus angustifolius]|uniref:Uncharacterized protein n=1 Tax=Lupinus angustifolius TaxID=3871 RepID=A0A394DDR0_LUPAN|nr:hypothetical protein TanjilG_02563 [Lupinus angustifolius]
MAATENNGSEKELAGVNGFLQVSEASTSATGSAGDVVNKGREKRRSFLCQHPAFEEQMQSMGKLAFDSFSEAIRLDPQNACALTHCGILFKEEGRLLEAAEPAYYNLGVVYSEMMQYDMALTFYEKAATERPMYAEAYCNMGVIFKNRGDLGAAMTCYERCLAVSPNFEIAKNNMAIALTDLGTKVKLEGDINQVFYELAFHFNPHCVEACNNLGVIYKDRDNLDKAVECYQLALSIKPNFSQSLNNFGVVYTVQGKMDASASMIEKAIIANPTYAEAYNNLGVLYRDAGEITQAINAYEQCLNIDPDSRNAGQVTWIGYPNTTGLPAIDYRITDSLADPPKTKQKHVEELVRLPECFLCYSPSPEAGPVCPTPALSNGFITFVSFNNLAKITPKVLQVWARILCAVPISLLVDCVDYKSSF